MRGGTTDGGAAPGADTLLPLVYDELRRIAARRLAGRGPVDGVQPTALVHEAYLRLAGAGRRWKSRAHFLATAARAIRQVLVDGARRRDAGKRGAGAQRVTLRDELLEHRPRTVDVLALHDALERLDRVDARQARIVELPFFGGLTGEEAARVLGVSPRTVDGDWRMARAWLYGELQDEEGAWTPSDTPG